MAKQAGKNVARGLKQRKRSNRSGGKQKSRTAFGELKAFLDTLENDTGPAKLPTPVSFAKNRVIDKRFAEGVGDKYFSPELLWLWQNVKRSLIGIHRTTITEFADEIRGKPPSAGPVEVKLYDLLNRQHKKDFSRLCNYLDTLFKKLLPLVLTGHAPLLENGEERELILQTVPGIPQSSPEASKREVLQHRLDLRDITRALVGNERILNHLLALHFLHTETRRSGIARSWRRPLFNALDELLVHADADHFRRKLRDVLAFNWDEIEHLRDVPLLREVYRRAGEPIRADEDVATPLRWLNRELKKLKLR